jgi:DNA-3-methyladenine glycosylase I
MNRCPRCLKDQLYIDYHDQEWWVPIHDDAKHFEFLVLETFQAWLSWHTILKKRENFRKAFDTFDPIKISHYNESKVNELMQDAGIIRNRAKIQATITNAQIFLDIQKKHGSWDAFIWRYTDNLIINNSREDHTQCPAKTQLSDKISTDLKKLGMKFVGSTVIYAHLQATGQINDHIVTCYCK